MFGRQGVTDDLDRLRPDPLNYPSKLRFSLGSEHRYPPAWRADEGFVMMAIPEVRSSSTPASLAPHSTVFCGSAFPETWLTATEALGGHLNPATDRHHKPGEHG